MSPSAFIATKGWNADSASFEITAGLAKWPLAAGRVASSMTSWAPLLRLHTTVASPASSIATLGDSVPAPLAERLTGGPKLPPAGRNDAWTIVPEPPRLVQATTVSPRSFMATAGNAASPPASESVTAAEGIPSLTVAASTRSLVPRLNQTTVASPAASTATCG